MFADTRAIEIVRLQTIAYVDRLTRAHLLTHFYAGWSDGFSIIRPGRGDTERRRKLLTAGCCGSCGGAPLETLTECATCAELGRGRAARTAERRRQAGQCAGCGEPDTEAGHKCEACRAAGRRIREARQLAGRCPCGDPAEPGREYCARCRERRAAQNRQRRAEARTG